MSTGSDAVGGGPTRAQQLRVFSVAVVPPVVMVLASLIVVSAWRSDLPDPVASHWGSSGADGTMSLNTLMRIVAVVGAVALIFGVVVAWRADRYEVVRAAIGLGNGLVALFAVMTPATASGQRGIDAAALMDTPVPAVGIVCSLVAAVLVGIASVFAVPRWECASDQVVGLAPQLDVAPSEQFLWRQRVSSSPALGVALGVIAAALSAAAAITST